MRWATAAFSVQGRLQHLRAWASAASVFRKRHPNLFPAAAHSNNKYFAIFYSVSVSHPCCCQGSDPLVTPSLTAHADNEYFATFYSDNVPYAQYFDSKRASHALSQDPGRRRVAHAWAAVSAVTSGFEAAGCCVAASRLGMLGTDPDQIAWQAALQLLLAKGASHPAAAPAASHLAAASAHLPAHLCTCNTCPCCTCSGAERYRRH